MKLEINLPDFIGFYESPLNDYEISDDIENRGDVTEDEYNQIDWKATHNAIGSAYLDKYWEIMSDYLKSIGVSEMVFKSIDSPRFYNYSSDKLVLDVTFEKETFIKEMKSLAKDNWSAFETFIKETYSSYSGFHSFYSNNANEWLDMLVNQVDSDNVIFEGFLTFAMELTDDYDRDEIVDKIVEYRNEYLKFL